MPPDTSETARQVGDYEILAKIAEGGMGAVYKARHRTTGAVVAVKVIPVATARNPLTLRRFEQEFRAASLIDHPNVVKAIEYCGTGTPFLVMEFVDGESLGAKVERDGPLPEAEAVRVIGQVCEGLHRAHKQGLIHRDVKPDNILVTAELTAKLTDLGLVKDVEGELNLTRTGRGLGTPHFMAPEQFRNAKNADVRCDVYSLGATLYSVVTGVVPFDKTSPLDCWLRKTKNDLPAPRTLAPALSERADWAIRRAMSSDPAARPASCREFMEDLLGTGWRVSGGSGSLSGQFVTSAASASAAATTVSGHADDTNPPLPPPDDLWYMVYRDPTGQTRTVKGATDSIRRNLATGALGDPAAILVSRTKGGQFQPLRSTPEFRDLALQLPAGNAGDAPAPPPAGPRPQASSTLLLGAGAAVHADTPDLAKLDTIPPRRAAVPPRPKRTYDSTDPYPPSPPPAASPFREAPPRRVAPSWLAALAILLLAIVALAVVLLLAVR
jgi:serine/threonine protein kinase